MSCQKTYLAGHDELGQAFWTDPVKTTQNCERGENPPTIANVWKLLRPTAKTTYVIEVKIKIERPPTRP